MIRVYILFGITFVICLFTGCVEQKQQTLVVTDYVPAKQVVVPNLGGLQQSAEQGNAVAQYKVGQLYACGLGVPKSHRLAMSYWKMAAKQDYAPAQYSLGLMYFNGVGVMTDYKEGCRWMRAAGEQGVQEAINYYNHYCVNAN